MKILFALLTLFAAASHMDCQDERASYCEEAADGPRIAGRDYSDCDINIKQLRTDGVR